MKTRLAGVTLGLLLCGLAHAQQAPVIVAGSVVNAADYSRQFAPGSLITIVGSNLAASMVSAPSFPLPTALSSVSVELVNGSITTLAPLYMVSPSQINAMLPYDVGSSVQVRVRTSAGVSIADTIAVSASAPRAFTVDQSGIGRAVTTDPAGGYLNRSTATLPGDTVTFWTNSLGAVTPAIAAGLPAGDGKTAPVNTVSSPVTVTVNGAAGQVTFAGLAPGYSGLYQVNVRMPYWNTIGDLPVVLRVGNSTSTQDISIPAEPNGFYWVIGGGKFPNGQTLNGASGTNGAIAHVHNSTGDGANGLRVWTKNLSQGVDLSALSGIAVTLKNGTTTVYDNNGIEDGTSGSFYNNQGGSVDDSAKAGSYVFVSNTKNVDSVMAGYMKITQPTTFTQIIGYFDGNGQDNLLPFNPANIYNKYRMNIWSADGSVPAAYNGFTGNVFSSDSIGGTFTYSDTGVSRIFKDGSKDPIYRLVYTLQSPITLQPGDYWFAHDQSLTPEAAATIGVSSEKGANMTSKFRVVVPDALFRVNE
jgi:uncharacterized protein (TIGR03437 family)